MDGAVPPQIESPKTFIGVGTRELVILGVCALLGTLSLFIPSHPAIRIGVAVLVAGLGNAAFSSDKRVGGTRANSRRCCESYRGCMDQCKAATSRCRSALLRSQLCIPGGSAGLDLAGRTS